jgi:drug/metabolite transporter (DMT)-like permease
LTAEALAAAAALSWGSSGLLAGFISRSRPAVLVALVVQLTGLALLLTVALAAAEAPSLRAAAAGIGCGIVGGVGLLWLYRALASRSVGVAAPLAASGILVPALAGVMGGERLGTAQAIGAVVLVLGVGAILYNRPGDGPDRRTVKLALGAALAFGIFYLGLDAGARDSAAWVTVFARVGGVGVLLVIALRARELHRLALGRWIGPAAVAGAVDAAGNLSYAAASATGALSVVSLISAAYPAVTVVLAVVVLRERITALRACGVLATVAGLGLIGG